MASNQSHRYTLNPPLRAIRNVVYRGGALIFLVAIFSELIPAQAYQPPFRQTVKNHFADPSPQTPKVVHSRLAGFGIPFKLNDPDEKYIEVQIYQSIDQGRNWEFLARQSTSADEFPFRAKGEGEYWFAMKTLDRDRRLLPEGDPQPELKIMIDLTQPELEFAVRTDRAGRVVCQWQAFDEFLDPAAARLQYRPLKGADSDSQWQDVTLNAPATPTRGAYTDQLAFWPDTSVTEIELRMAVADLAGNAVVAARKTVVQAPAWRASTRSTARPTDRPAVDPSQVQLHPPAGPRQPVEDPTAWQNAFYSKLRRQQNQHLVDRKPPQRTAQQTSQKRIRAQLVGSEPEVAAPPIPSGWVINSSADQQTQRPVIPEKLQTFKKPPTLPPYKQPPSLPVDSAENIQSHSWNGPPVGQPQQQFRRPSDFANPSQSPNPQTGGSGQRSTQLTPSRERHANRQYSGDVWESTVERHGNDTQTSVSTTSRPDRSLAPIATSSGRSPLGSADAVRANPRSFETVGDRAIGTSSTRWPSNQYRGPAHSKPPTNPQIEITPDIAGVPSAIFQSQPSGVSDSVANQPPATLPHGNTPARLATSRPLSPSNDLGHRAGQDLPSKVPTNYRRSTNSQFASSPRNIGRPSTNGPTKSNTQVISTPRFRLQYDINAIDPSGVGRVDLWITEDLGSSWKLWGNDPDMKSPFPVEVQKEGLFGFRVVIHSRDGLAGEGPSSGDDADMWVRVDTQSPLAQITSVPYGRGKEAGRLVINYRVADPFLVLRPVRLSYSRAPQGPWTVIQENLRNEGRYLWKVDRVVPDRIFLRVEAIDQAGNTGTHVLPQTIDVSGLVPRGTVRAVEPVGAR